jgi:hypothetical protein
MLLYRNAKGERMTTALIVTFWVVVVVLITGAVGYCINKLNRF